MSKIFQAIVIGLLILIFGAVIGLFVSSNQPAEADHYLELQSEEYFQEFGEHVEYHIFTLEQLSRYFKQDFANEQDLYEYLEQQNYELEDGFAEKELGCSFDLVLQEEVCRYQVIEKINENEFELIEIIELEEFEEFEEELYEDE